MNQYTPVDINNSFRESNSMIMKMPKREQKDLEKQLDKEFKELTKSPTKKG